MEVFKPAQVSWRTHEHIEVQKETFGESFLLNENSQVKRKFYSLNRPAPQIYRCIHLFFY